MSGKASSSARRESPHAGRPTRCLCARGTQRANWRPHAERRAGMYAATVPPAAAGSPGVTLVLEGTRGISSPGVAWMAVGLSMRALVRCPRRVQCYEHRDHEHQDRVQAIRTSILPHIYGPLIRVMRVTPSMLPIHGERARPHTERSAQSWGPMLNRSSGTTMASSRVSTSSGTV